MRKIKIQHTKFSSKQSLRQSQKNLRNKDFLQLTTVQIQPSLSYQTETKHTTLAIPNPKTVFAIASFQKQKKIFLENREISDHWWTSRHLKPQQSLQQARGKGEPTGCLEMRLSALLFHPL